MFTFIIALILLALSLVGIAVRKTYYLLPPKELKRQARYGDEYAKVLYKAVAYGGSLRLLLWLYIGVTAALGLVLLSRSAAPVVAFAFVVLTLWYGFAWMPSGRVGHLGGRLAMMATPALSWLLNYLHPVLDRLTRFVQNHRHVEFHTGLYERDDLIELLEDQKQLADSRIAVDELDLAIHALHFGDVQVRDVLVPRRAVKTVADTDIIGPILMGELHDSGYSRFPVYQGKQDNIVGTLYLRDLINVKQGGQVGSVMQPSVYYVHEDHTLYQVLHAFLKTKHHLFVVVNSFEEYVGIITIEDVLEQVIGHPITDEFDRYEDMRAVAAHTARQEHDSHETIPETVTEVVE